MTPWGIRKRIQGVLGKGTPVASEQVEVRLTLPDGVEHTVRCEARYTLVMASQTLDTPISTDCPDGACGHCAVEVLDGRGLLDPSPAEARIIAEKGLGAQRLACHAKVGGNGARVKVKRVWTIDSTRGL